MQALECFTLRCQGSQCTPQYDYFQEVGHGSFVPRRFLSLALPSQYHACKLIHKVTGSWSFFSLNESDCTASLLSPQLVELRFC